MSSENTIGNMTDYKEKPQDSVAYYLSRVKIKALDDYRTTYEHEMNMLRKLAPVKSSARILEMGCGTGWFTLLARRDGYAAVGIDTARTCLQFAARERAAQSRIEPAFVQADASALPFPNNFFSFIIANSVLEHVPDWKTALKEAYRVLAPGGVVFFATTNRCYPISGEIPFPLYPWLPFPIQKKIAVFQRGPDILATNHIAWNNFTHPILRRGLVWSGFKEVYDLVDITDPGDVQTITRRGLARRIIPMARKYSIVRWLLYWGFSNTVFLAKKSKGCGVRVLPTTRRD